MSTRVSRADGAKVCGICGNRTRHKPECPLNAIYQIVPAVPRSRARLMRGTAIELLRYATTTRQTTDSRRESSSDDEEKQEDKEEKEKKEDESQEEDQSPRKKLRRIDQNGRSVCSLCGNSKRHKADCTWKKAIEEEQEKEPRVKKQRASATRKKRVIEESDTEYSEASVSDRATEDDAVVELLSSNEEASADEASEPQNPDREINENGRRVCSICKSPARHKLTCSLLLKSPKNRGRTTRQSRTPTKPQVEGVVDGGKQKRENKDVQDAVKEDVEEPVNEPHPSTPESRPLARRSRSGGSGTEQKISNERRILGENGRNICANCKRPGRHTRECLFNPERDFRSSISAINTAKTSSPEPIVLVLDDPSDDQGSDEPLIDVFLSSASVSGPVESPFLSKSWKECQTTLPKLQGLQIEESLDRSKWPSWKYTLTDPLLSASPSLDEGQFTYGGHDIFVWCPFTFFPHAIDIKTLKCIACGGAGVVADGWTRGFHPILTLNGRKSYVKCRRLRHPKCPKAESTGATGMKFSSFHKTLLTQWYSPDLLATLPFRLLGKRFVSIDLLTFANEMQGRMSPEELVQLVETMEDRWLQRRQDIVAQCTVVRREQARLASKD